MKKLLLVFHIILVSLNIFSTEYFKGYNYKNTDYHTVSSLLQSKYNDHSKWNENYYHEAQFKDQGITIFTNIIFSNAFFDKKGCKINCIITFKDGSKYVFNKDYKSNEYTKSSNAFYFEFDKNYIKLNNNKYILHIEDNKINLDLTYNIINPPFIFGDGIVNIDSNYFLGFSQPILGANINGHLFFNNKKYNLTGYGSVNHDHSIAPPVKNPLKWRSFWLYDKNISIVIHSFTLKNGEQIDRIIINQDGKLKASFLNSGLKQYQYITDEKTNFNYPTKFKINYKDKSGNEINAVIDFIDFTDKIQAFSHLSPLVHSLASMAVGEMWSYRFWVDAEFTLLINNKQEKFNISGLCNYIDVVK